MLLTQARLKFRHLFERKEQFSKTNPVFYAEILRDYFFELDPFEAHGLWPHLLEDILHLPFRPVLKTRIEAHMGPIFGRSCQPGNGFHHPMPAPKEYPDLDGFQGVIGLTVTDPFFHPDSQPKGLVLPLEVKSNRNAQWSVASNLPFQSDKIQSLLARVLNRPSLVERALPERFGFDIPDPLGFRILGNSMDIAALMGVLLAARQSESPLGTPSLGPICALVQPLSPTSERLVPVDHLEEKLAGFAREYGKGGLLILSSQTRIETKYLNLFASRWQVESLAELGDHLEDNGWFDPFLTTRHLTSEELAGIQNLLHRFERTGEYAKGRKLATQALGLIDPLKTRREDREALEQSLTNFHRHLGEFFLAKQRAETIFQFSPSHDASAKGKTLEAAALIDAHDFFGAVNLLTPIRASVAKDPLIINPSTHIHMLNTLGRALGYSRNPQFQAIFQESLDLIRKTDPVELPRALCYLANASIWSGEKESAHVALRQLDSLKGLNPFSDGVALCLKAKWATRGGPPIEVSPDLAQPGLPNHIRGYFRFYLAQTPNISKEQSQKHFAEAACWFGKDRSKDGFLLNLLEQAAKLGEAACGDCPKAYQHALKNWTDSLKQANFQPLRNHYLTALPEKQNLPTESEILEYLKIIPFF